MSCHGVVRVGWHGNQAHRHGLRVYGDLVPGMADISSSASVLLGHARDHQHHRGRRRRRGPSRQGCSPRKRRRGSPLPSPMIPRAWSATLQRCGGPGRPAASAMALAGGGIQLPRARSCPASDNDDQVLRPLDLDRTYLIQRPKMNPVGILSIVRPGGRCRGSPESRRSLGS